MGIDMTMTLGNKPNVGAIDNFDLLCDIEVLLSLACFVPFINAMHCLIKLSEARNIFICNFLQVVKLCQEGLAQMFLDASTTFKKADFHYYSDLVSLSCVDIPLVW